ncbi:hypothetical protein [Phenylobacterium aquaticum]|uniref:hypothetical protein n=1 Tax=Phenylobacterium aquaticum TaxID=1763816 RepID=UPI0026ECF304|nr:hypothetical protein [Phenylobacterium aquaticum]
MINSVIRSSRVASLLGFALLAGGGWASGAFAGEAPSPLPEQADASVGYPTVAAALADLSVKPGVEVSIQNGWTIVADPAASAIWSFAPRGDAAYPTVVRRVLTQTGPGVSLEMTVLCEASKDACDSVVRTFQELNAAASKSAR